MSELKMPKRGQSARMLAELQAEHASQGVSPEGIQGAAVTHVTTLQETPASTSARASDTSPVTFTVPSFDTPNERTSDETHRATTPTASATRRPIHQAAHSDQTASDTAPTRKHAGWEERFSLAIARASADEVAVVTVRVSAALNRYMDDYTARINRLDPKRKYRKQDAVLEAFAAFYADHPMPPAPDEGEL